MFVELLGLPAAGKSTLLKNFSHQARQSGYRIGAARELDKADVTMAGYIRRTPVPRALYRYEILRRKYPEYFRLVDDLAAEDLTAKALLLASAVRQEIYKAHPDTFDMVLIDEGCIHRGIHLILKHSEEPEAFTETYSDLVPAPDAIVYLEFSPEQSHAAAVTRLQTRDGGKSTAEAIEQRINAAHGGIETLHKRTELMEQVITHMGRRGVPVIRVPAREDPIKNARKVSETLSALRNECV